VNALLRALSYFRPDAGRIGVVLVLLLVSVGLNVLKPWPFALLVDNVLGKKPYPSWAPETVKTWNALTQITAIALALLAVSFLLAPVCMTWCLMGMGCGAAIPNLEAAAGMLARSREGPVLSLAVEICTATIFPSHEPELVVSNSIFGDGAAAAVLDLAPDNHPGGLARMVDFATGLFPQYREDLRYRTEGGCLRNHPRNQIKRPRMDNAIRRLLRRTRIACFTLGLALRIMPA